MSESLSAKKMVDALRLVNSEYDGWPRFSLRWRVSMSTVRADVCLISQKLVPRDEKHLFGYHRM